MICVCVFIYMYWNACCNYAEKSSKTSLLTLGVFLLITGLFSPLPGLLQHDPVLEFPIIGISPAGRCIDKYIYICTRDAFCKLVALSQFLTYIYNIIHVIR